MKHKWSLFAFAAAVAIAVAAETLKVERAEVALRERPDIYGPAVATLPKGATLNVLEKNKTFAKVDFDGKVGWIRLADLKVKKNVGTNADAAGGISPSGNAAEAGAGKGIGDKARAYGQAKGGDPEKIVALTKLRQKLIDSGEWQTWAAAGKVGAANKGGN